MYLCTILFFFFPGRIHLSGYDTAPSLETASLLQCPQTRSLTFTFRSVPLRHMSHPYFCLLYYSPNRKLGLSSVYSFTY